MTGNINEIYGLGLQNSKRCSILDDETGADWCYPADCRPPIFRRSITTGISSPRVDVSMPSKAYDVSFGKRSGVTLLAGVPGIIALVGYIYGTTPPTAVPTGLSLPLLAVLSAVNPAPPGPRVSARRVRSPPCGIAVTSPQPNGVRRWNLETPPRRGPASGRCPPS